MTAFSLLKGSNETILLAGNIWRMAVWGQGYIQYIYVLMCCSLNMDQVIYRWRSLDHKLGPMPAIHHFLCTTKISRFIVTDTQMLLNANNQIYGNCMRIA